MLTSGSRDTDDSVLNIFLIFTLFMFSRSKNPLLIFRIAIPCLGDLENPGRLPFNSYSEVYWWLWLVDFWHFITICVIEVNESFADIPTELRFGELENSGQLAVQEVFEVIRTFVRCLKNALPLQAVARVSPDGHKTNALLPNDLFHTQFIRIRNNRVRWMSRRVPIPYRISGI